jgi:micrococcal nuclease
MMPAAGTVLRGTCRVIDGDTIVIDSVHIRLAGIDAPEIDHPYGQQSKWALVRLCKGRIITAHIRPELSYDRVVADCFLPDGRDLAAEMVRAGLAIDWAKFSGGKYRALEVPDVRKKLWRAHARQQGRSIPSPGGMAPPVATVRPIPRPAPPRATQAGWTARPARNFTALFLWAPVGAVVLIGMVGCAVGMGGRNTTAPVVSSQRPAVVRPQVQQAPIAPASPVPSFNQTMESSPAAVPYRVEAERLNIRAEPSAQSAVIGQLERGAVIDATGIEGNWIAIISPDGTTGWVHADYLSVVAR